MYLNSLSPLSQFINKETETDTWGILLDIKDLGFEPQQTGERLYHTALC